MSASPPSALAVVPARGAAAELPDVVVLNDFAHVQGGGSKVAVLSAAALAAQGHRVLFFAAVGPVDPMLTAHRVEVVCLHQTDALTDGNPLRGAARALWNEPARRALAAALTAFEPHRTVVHLHGWMKALSSSVVRCATDGGFPTVSTLHDYTAVCPNGGFYNYRTERACSLPPASARCIATNCDSRSYGHKAWRLTRHLIQQHYGGFRRPLATYVYLSDLNRRLHAPLLPTGADMHHVPNPIDVPHQAAGAPAQSSVFAFAGRLAPEKGALLFAAASTAEQVPALFIGDGPQAEAVRKLAPAAEITGWLPAAEVRKRLRQARILVFPSLWPETHGLVVQEAAALGVPAIVSDACAARESIEPEVTGLLFRSGDLQDLRRQIERCRSERLIARMGRAAYDRYWRAPPTPRAHAAALADLYANVLAGGVAHG